MRKIVYLNYIVAPNLSMGVLKKINHQTKILEGLGMEVITSVFYAQGEVPRGLKYIEFHRMSCPSVFFHPFLKKIYRSLAKWKYADRFLSEKSFDFILIRRMAANFMSDGFVKKYGKLTIVEHQTKEIPELYSSKSFTSFIRAQLEKRYGKRVLQGVKGIIGVTPEIIDYELSRIDISKPNIVISNGIDIKETPLSTRPFYDGKELSLLFVGSNDTPWDGIDRLLRGIALYDSEKSIPKINLHLVGNITSYTKKMVSDLRIEDNVCFHEYLYEEEIDKIFDLAHIAIGTLALHRKKMRQACPLKVREYTARGIPFVIAYDDVDLEDNLPFYLRIPPDDSPIDIEKIVKWANSVSKSKDLSFYMREYAIKKMDWKVKMKQLADFLDRTWEK